MLIHNQSLTPTFHLFTLLTLVLPHLTASTLSLSPYAPSPQETTLIQCISLLLLGMFLSALATAHATASRPPTCFLSSGHTTAAATRSPAWTRLSSQPVGTTDRRLHPVTRG